MTNRRVMFHFDRKPPGSSTAGLGIPIAEIRDASSRRIIIPKMRKLVLVTERDGAQQEVRFYAGRSLVEEIAREFGNT